jgi:hypothetical protein
MADETDGQMVSKADGGNTVKVAPEASQANIVIPTHYSLMDRVANVGGKVLCGLAGILFLTSMAIATIGGPAYQGSDRAKYSKEASTAMYGCVGAGVVGAGLIKYSRRNEPKPKKEERQGLRS